MGESGEYGIAARTVIAAEGKRAAVPPPRGNAMITVSVVLLIAAFILFVLAAISVPVPRVNLIGAGLACWILAQLISQIK